MIVPTRRTLVLVLILTLLAFIGVLTVGYALVFAALLVALIIAMGMDAIAAIPSRALKVEVSAPGLIFIGDPDPVTLSVTPDTPMPVRLSLLLDAEGDIAPFEPLSLALLGRHESTFALPITPYRRGTASLSRLWLRWTGPLGLMARVESRALNTPLNIVPNIRALKQGELAMLLREVLAGRRLQIEKGEGTEFDSLREYVPGLDTRTIDWKQSAKHRELVCKEYVTERNHPIVLAFDCGYLMREHLDGVPRLDHAINASLGLAWLSLHQGDLAGLYSFDSRPRLWFPPARGKQAFSVFQRLTADLSYRTEEPNHTLGLSHLATRLNRRALIILFTEFIDTTTASLMVEDVESLARKHLVVFVTQRDPQLARLSTHPPDTIEGLGQAVLAGDALEEREQVLARLRRVGVQTIDVPAGNLPVSLINTYLRIKQRNLI